MRGTALRYAAVDSKPNQRFAEPEKYAGFRLCDPLEKRIGMVEKLFLNWSGEPEYIRVSVGFFGFKSVLLPVQDVAVDEQRQILMLTASNTDAQVGCSSMPNNAARLAF